MKTMLCVISVLLLCSCATAPSLQTSYNGHSFASGPTSLDDPRLRSPQYYMDDDDRPSCREVCRNPLQFRALDGFCNANCQANRHTAEYCSRACGM